MGIIATASLAGNRVVDACSTIPAWGASYHDVVLDKEVTLSGKVVFTLADLLVKGTVLSGGPAITQSFYRVVSGAAGWGKTIPKRSYANDIGIKLSTVLGDAASECGETIDPSTVDPKVTLGPSWVRKEGPACRLLEQLSPNAWFVGEDGVTRLGKRPAGKLSSPATRTTQVDLARGTVTLASESIVNILPGLVVNGLEAIDVEHEYSAKGALRSKIWGRRGVGNSRRLAALRVILDQLDPDRAFRGLYEYRIVTQEGERLNLQPVRVSTGMPDLRRVFVRPGIPGVSALYSLGARVVVGFVDADPARPVVLAFEDAEGNGFLPALLKLAGGGPAVGRVGDVITITQAQLTAATAQAGGNPVMITTPLQGTISSGSSKVTSG